MTMTREWDEDWNEPDLPSWMFDEDGELIRGDEFEDDDDSEHMGA
jgi:hypothetical protein